LSWERLTAPENAKAVIQAEPDEQATQDVCMAAVLRNTGRLDETRKVLEGVIAMDK
jgi:hypothetical protein